MSLYEDIRKQADTIEMLSGERPVGIRLTMGQLLTLCGELGDGHGTIFPEEVHKIHGLLIEVMDDNTRA